MICSEDFRAQHISGVPCSLYREVSSPKPSPLLSPFPKNMEIGMEDEQDWDEYSRTEEWRIAEAKKQEHEVNAYNGAHEEARERFTYS